MKIFLIGFMGSGKSHIGKSLAQLLNVDFIDLDKQIAHSVGKSIPAIFEESGEPTFRQFEQEQLKVLSVVADAVIATGGGTPCFFDNMEWMNQNGLTIYLKTDEGLLAERLRSETDQRPLLKELSEQDLLAFIQKKLDERAKNYEQARIVFKQNHQTANTASAVLNEISLQIGFDGPGKMR